MPATPDSPQRAAAVGALRQPVGGGDLGSSRLAIPRPGCDSLPHYPQSEAGLQPARFVLRSLWLQYFVFAKRLFKICCASAKRR